eukprot:gene7959-12425_t
MFFDKGLISMGNLMFLGGITLTSGIAATFKFFFQTRKWKGTLCFFIGFFLVLFGWAFIGMLVEGFGFLNLFGDFFPTVIAFLRNVPIIGNLLNMPGIRNILDSRMGILPE